MGAGHVRRKLGANTGLTPPLDPLDCRAGLRYTFERIGKEPVSDGVMKPTEMRDLVPALGLREYWYPALLEKKIRKKPVGIRIMGEDIVLFRGASDEVAALTNVCPHRGGSLMEGDCHYRGTVACPYHGWVFDEHGDCLAVLSEGPDSRMPGKVRARKYPTRTLKGLVFIWMGEGRPVPIEDDVPPEFFDGRDIRIFLEMRHWPINWRVALENTLDSHVLYVHRNSILQLREPVVNLGRFGYRPRVVNGRASVGHIVEPPKAGRLFYPALDAYWPKTHLRRFWLWIFHWRLDRWRRYPPFNRNEEWDMHTTIDGERKRSGGHHLPTMFRIDYGPHLYTRCCVPISETETRVFYYHSVRRRTRLGKVVSWLYFRGFHLRAMNDNFSPQDFRAMAPQRYDTPEMLSGTDAEIINWRKLLLSARGMPSDLATPEADPRYDVEAAE